jgi:beta-glucosidase
MRRIGSWRVACAATLLLAGAKVLAGGADAARPWLDASRSADERAALALAAMTPDEKFGLITGYFGTSTDWNNGGSGTDGYTAPAEALPGSAGYVPGIARLGIPPQWETDAGIGVASQSAGPWRGRTSLPAGLATAATWNPELAFRGGAMIGAEARASGFNVMLAGGVNLARDPRNGRNFEYGGEDPLLAGVMVGQQVRGIQSNHLIATVKHYAINDQETGRKFVDSRISTRAARMSDLFAFEVALGIGDPGSVMCSYNLINGVYACENPEYLNRVLKGDFGFRGYVMSDWGAVHSTVASALGGLDQESAAWPFDSEAYFAAPLRAAVASGSVPQARVDDMVLRILRALFATGVVDHPVAVEPIDFDAHAVVSQLDAEEGIVLLRNRNRILPLTADAGRVAVIGAHADAGVLSGGGSAQVYPVGGPAVRGLGPKQFPGPIVYLPDAPLAAIARRLPSGSVRYASGHDIAGATALARSVDTVLLFVEQWSTEQEDRNWRLPDDQERLVEAVVRANARTIVVLETPGAVRMRWLPRTAALLEAWYPGTRGGEAIARVLFGEVDASGRLPLSFPQSEAQLPRHAIDGIGLAAGARFAVNYTEGAAVGYKWYDRQRLTPLFPFGAGLSYGSFRFARLAVQARGAALTVEFDVRNTGERTAKAVPQIYVGTKGLGWEAPRRLGGWQKLELAPGATTHVSLQVDPRVLRVWSEPRGWTIASGDYTVQLATSAADVIATATVHVDGDVGR